LWPHASRLHHLRDSLQHHSCRFARAHPQQDPRPARARRSLSRLPILDARAARPEAHLRLRRAALRAAERAAGAPVHLSAGHRLSGGRGSRTARLPADGVIPEMSLSSSERERYRRHLALAEIGTAGQEKLKAARVLIVGAGGLGSPAALYLTA